MNKNKILISVLAVALVVALAIGWLTWKKEPSSTSEQVPTKDFIGVNDWLRAATLSELEAYASQAGVALRREEEMVYASPLSFCGNTVTYNYRLNSEDQVVQFAIGSLLNPEDGARGMTAQELRTKIEIVLSWISSMLDVEIGEAFTVIAEGDNILSAQDDATYEQIRNGTAGLSLRILDIDDSVWCLTIRTVLGNKETILCRFEHYMAGSQEAQSPCNVAIERKTNE